VKKESLASWLKKTVPTGKKKEGPVKSAVEKKAVGLRHPKKTVNQRRHKKEKAKNTPGCRSAIQDGREKKGKIYIPVRP